MSDGPKILTIDIETSPNLAAVFDLFQQNISLPQLLQSTRVICFAAKWHHEPYIMFSAEWLDGHERMIQVAYELLDEADIVVHYNGKRFDIPHLNREFLELGLTPPSPYKQVDLYQVVKREFRFSSSKLAHVTEKLNLTGKAKHEGLPLWLKVLEGDESAQDAMERYNAQDVETTEELYDLLLPWINNHPHHGLYVDEARPVCNRCGSTRMHKRGVAYTTLGAYQRFQCQSCGGWSRSGRRVNAVDVRGVAS